MVILFPIGGKGTRFVEAGYETPKQFLRIRDIPMLSLAISSYPKDARYLFLVRPEHIRLTAHMTPNYSAILPTRKETSGPIETILTSGIDKTLDTDEDILIADCDSFLKQEEMESALTSFRSSNADGGCTVRKTSNPGCSFASIQDRWITETREKDQFTDWSTTGPYWFKSSRKFLKYAQKAFDSAITSISPVYNFMIQDGARVRAFPVKTFVHLGTPKEYESYVRGTHLQQMA